MENRYARRELCQERMRCECYELQKTILTNEMEELLGRRKDHHIFSSWRFLGHVERAELA